MNKEQETTQSVLEEHLRETIFQQEDFISKLAIRSLKDNITGEEWMLNEYALRFELGKVSAYYEILGIITNNDKRN